MPGLTGHLGTPGTGQGAWGKSFVLLTASVCGLNLGEVVFHVGYLAHRNGRIRSEWHKWRARCPAEKPT